MDDRVRRIPPIEAFLRGGGTFVVLRPVPIKMGDVLSLQACRKLAQVREKAVDKGRVNLVLTPPYDDTAFVTVDKRGWPLPVLLADLALPADGTREGALITEARTQFGNSMVREYLRLQAPVAQTLLDWAQRATLAISRTLAVRMVRGGRVIICGGHPFIRLLGQHLVPSGMIWSGALYNVRIYDEEGVVVSLNDRGHVALSPLFPRPMFMGGEIGYLPSRR